MNTPRYLTKSRFKLACECPTKLFYTKKREYADKKDGDSFLLALADGGFQVGELAKCYFPGGTEILSRKYDDALNETNTLLEQENAIIYEAAVEAEGFFIRVDVLIKHGDQIDLIEVKSKSIDSTKDVFTNKNGTIASGWKPYLFDIAFQNYVASLAFPDKIVRPFLMLADKSVNCPTDGLNQKFRVKTGVDGNKHAFIARELTREDLSPQMLCKVDVSDICRLIYDTSEGSDDLGRSFTERAEFYRDYYRKDEKIVTPISAVCGKCEFVTNKNEDADGKVNGFRECWSNELGWSSEDFLEPIVFNISNYHQSRKAKRFEERRLHIREFVEDDVSPKGDDKSGMSQSERQWLQVTKLKNNDTTVFLDKQGLISEMQQWIFPLHFIDFETSMAAIPFNKGRRPYEGIAFQFSHHIVHKDGRIEHIGEYLNARQGQFPNYDFVRALNRELSSDDGTIFRYHEHENNYLNMIYRQLSEDDSNITDREKLLEFIRTITRSSKDYSEQWVGERNMVDLCRLVKRYYYDPLTNGSNSIKAVLPAILRSSAYLKQKYADPIYGSAAGIPSLNFVDQSWIRSDDDSICDPYKMLPKMFEDLTDTELALITEGDELNDGGGAMTAYGRLQYEDMSEYERSAIEKALLKYCELDTLAMVMIYEAWREMLKD